MAAERTPLTNDTGAVRARKQIARIYRAAPRLLCPSLPDPPRSRAATGRPAAQCKLIYGRAGLPDPGDSVLRPQDCSFKAMSSRNNNNTYTPAAARRCTKRPENDFRDPGQPAVNCEALVMEMCGISHLRNQESPVRDCLPI